LSAGRDPRIERVVAVASFVSMREVVESVASRWTPFKGKVIDGKWIERILEVAERRGGFDRDASNPEARISDSKAEILLIHGVQDPLTPFEHSERLRQAAPDRTYLIPLFDAGHIAPIYRLREITALSAISFFNIGSTWESVMRSRSPSSRSETERARSLRVMTHLEVNALEE